MSKPSTSGYAEAKPNTQTQRDKPNPDAAGNEAAQVASTLPGEDDAQEESGDEPTPPGENKREPINDPDPADTKMHVQQGSR